MNAPCMDYIGVRNSWFIVTNGNIRSAYGLDRTSIEYIDDHRFACNVMRNPSKYVACQGPICYGITSLCRHSNRVFLVTSLQAYSV